MSDSRTVARRGGTSLLTCRSWNPCSVMRSVKRPSSTKVLFMINPPNQSAIECPINRQSLLEKAKILPLRRGSRNRPGTCRRCYGLPAVTPPPAAATAALARVSNLRRLRRWYINWVWASVLQFTCYDETILMRQLEKKLVWHVWSLFWYFYEQIVVLIHAPLQNCSWWNSLAS